MKGSHRIACVSLLICVAAVGSALELVDYTGYPNAFYSFWDSSVWQDPSTQMSVVPDAAMELHYASDLVRLSTGEWYGIAPPSPDAAHVGALYVDQGELTLSSNLDNQGAYAAALTIDNDLGVEHGSLVLSSANVTVAGTTRIGLQGGAGLLIDGIGAAGSYSLTAVDVVVGPQDPSLTAGFLLQNGANVYLSGGLGGTNATVEIHSGSVLDAMATGFNGGSVLIDGGSTAMSGLFSAAGTDVKLNDAVIDTTGTTMFGTSGDFDLGGGQEAGTHTAFVADGSSARVSATNVGMMVSAPGSSSTALFDHGATLQMHGVNNQTPILINLDSRPGGSAPELTFDHGASLKPDPNWFWYMGASQFLIGDDGFNASGTVRFLNGSTGWMDITRVVGGWGGGGNSLMVVDGQGTRYGTYLMNVGGHTYLGLPFSTNIQGGQALLQVSDGADVVVGRWDMDGAPLPVPNPALVVFSGGQVDVSDGGAIYVGNGTDPHADHPTPEFASGALIVGPDGVLAGGGTVYSHPHIIGNVLNHGGSIQPGFSPGVLGIQGDLIQTSGDIVLEVGSSAYDQLFVTGNADIEGGSITFKQYGTGSIAGGDLYFFPNGVTIGDGVAIDIAQNLQNLGFTFDRDTGEGHAPVPEPASITALAVGLALVARRLKRRSIR